LVCMEPIDRQPHANFHPKKRILWLGSLVLPRAPWAQG
jgi:hypothetical protein